MESTKPREVKPWLRRVVEAAGALDAMPRAITGLKQSLSPNQLILGQQNEGNRIALNLNLLLPPFCCHDLRVGGESIQEAAGVWLRVLKCCAFLVGWQTNKTANVTLTRR